MKRAMLQWRAAVAVLCALVCLVAAVHHAVVVIPFPYPLEYPEGVTAHWTHEAARGASLYPEVVPDAPLHDPYPPLFMRTAGVWVRWFDGPFTAARTVAFVALAWTVVMVFVCLRRSGMASALAGSALFGLSITALRYGTQARVDMLGLALSVSSVALLAGAGAPAGVFASAAAGAAAAGALLVKPTFFAAALAGAWIVGVRGRRSAVAWAVGFGVAACAGATLFGAPLGRIVQHLWSLNRLPWSAKHLALLLLQELARHPLLAAGLALFLARGPRGRRADAPAGRDALWIYVVCALPSCLLAGKTGADANYFLELLAAAGLAAGCVGSSMAAAEDGPSRARARQMLPLLAAMQFALYLPILPAPVFTRTYEQEIVGGTGAWTPTAGDAETGARLADEIRRAASVLSQSPGLALSGGKTPVWDAYQFTQLAAAGRWDDAPLAARIDRAEFGLLVVSGNAAERTNVSPPRIAAAIDRAYVPYREIGTWLLLKPMP